MQTQQKTPQAILHPPDAPCFLLRFEYLAITGDRCASLVLDLLEQGAMAGRVQFTASDVVEQILDVYRERWVRLALDLLAKKGLVSIKPGSTARIYELNIEAINTAIAEKCEGACR